MKIDGESIKGSIDLLEHFLAEDIPTQELNDIIQPLRMVQKLRSSGVAHRKGKKFPKMLRRYNLDKLTNDKKVEKLIKKLTESLKLLIDYISAF